MILYITEKPSQIKPLIEALKQAGIYKNIIIKSLLGHILALKDFKMLDNDFKNKNWNTLIKENKIPYFPATPFNIQNKYMSNKKIFNDISKEIKNADSIIIASDPDDEGVTLVSEVVEKCGMLHKISGIVNMNKLDVYSLSKEVKILNKLPYKEMYEAGQSRALFDMLFGFNATIMATEYLTDKNQLLNIGAVKLPTIRMVVERDLEFESHSKIPYYVITAKAKYQGNIFDVKFKIKDKKYTEIDEKLKEEIETAIKQSNGIIDIFKKENKQTPPPKPYSLTDLQRESNTKYKFTAQKVLDLAQSLYEKHKVQSYPRTDNNYYSDGEYLQAKDILNSLASVKLYGKFISKLDLDNLLKRKIFDDSKITAHTALAPTIEAKIEKLSGIDEDEKKIFHLVATRYIIQLK
jgi:DNA topoisomerase-3